MDLFKRTRSNCYQNAGVRVRARENKAANVAMFPEALLFWGFKVFLPQTVYCRGSQFVYYKKNADILVTIAGFSLSCGWVPGLPLSPFAGAVCCIGRVFGRIAR